MQELVCQKCRQKNCTSKVRLFEGLNEEEVQMVKSQMKYETVDKGEMIFHEGGASDTLYFVNAGKIKLYKYTKSGKEQILYILSEGDFFGELELLSHARYKFNAKAIEKADLCMLTKESIKESILQKPEIGIKLLESVAGRLAVIENLAYNLAINDIDARVAYLILECIDKYSVMRKGKCIVHLPISREEMANYIGVTRETISRKLKKFEDEGLIELVGNKTMVIIDQEGINQYIE